MNPTKEVYIIDDIFDDTTIDQLYSSCQKHFEDNLLSSDFIDITNSIVDCHGLALSQSKYFPYSEKCWNILCLKIKKYVVEYCSRCGYDESFVVPFSCWAERVDTGIKQDVESIKELIPDFDDLTPEDIFASDKPILVNDYQVKKHMLRVVYYLKTEDPFFGTKIYFDGEEKKIQSKNNRLIIYDGYSYKSHHYYPEKLLDYRTQYNIVFDWYINDPFDVPDWVLP